MRSAVRVSILALVVLAARVARADGDTAARFRLASQPHAGMPFEVQLMVDGFDQTPAPEQPRLEIPGATVTALGAATPQVSQSIQIINGRRSESIDVRWVFRYRILAANAGQLHLPSVTASQGSKRATAPAGDVDVDAVQTTDDMKLELHVPDRPVFVGETVPVTLVWLFRRQPEDQTFNVPMLALEDAFTISEPPAPDPQRALKLEAGSKEVTLPFTVDETDVNGTKFNRVTITFYAAPRKIGKVDIPASTVVAPFAVGRGDIFGRAPTRMFRAADVPRTLEVKPLPETDRPASFAGAVGTSFSIAARTSRSVVQLGEPLDIDITVKSDQRLDTLSLGDLGGPGGLPKDKFQVPNEAPTGELSDDGKTKTFKVTAQLIAQAPEIPAIELAYFDPVKGAYETIHSDPIALSVKGGAMVNASDVVSSSPAKRLAAPGGDQELSLVGAELALSSPGDADDRPLGGAMLWLLVGLLYAVPAAIFLLRRWQLRTAADREDAAEVKLARRKVEDELARADRAPAREVAGPLGAALRGLARALELPIDDTIGGTGALATLETESFSPSAASQPLSPDVRASADALMRRLIADGRKRRGSKRGAATAAAVIMLIAAIAGTARADAEAQARGEYQDAMGVTAPTPRKAAFARAAASLGDAARIAPDRPELLADWGNAALEAGDVATATLAYRRALRVDAGNGRARKNLAWLRSHQPQDVRRAAAGAADSLFFFHYQWSRARRLLVGAGAFALAVLLLVPWTGRRRRSLAGLAIIPAAVWLAMLVSVIVEDRGLDDGVVMDGVVLRAADSAGAPAALAEPLPRGAEVTIVEKRDGWTRIRLSAGATGWVASGAVEPVTEK